MPSLELFPFSDYWWFYTVFLLFILSLLALDLGVFNRQAHAVSLKEAALWSAAWISLALLFCLGFWQYIKWELPHYEPLITALASRGITGTDAIAGEAARLANQSALEFLTGFVVEKALSIDNIFIFIVIFRFFGIPGKYQHRVLFFGVLGALVFRAVFIGIGAVLIRFEWVLWVFGVFLIFTGAKLFFAEEKVPQPEKNIFIRLLRRVIPITKSLDGQRFFTRRKSILCGTPLLVCLVFLEVTDIVFAVDSVPAIFAITKEPLIVFTSNIFAILGLRSLFFLLAGVMPKFHLLRYGLALILIFVGLKMTLLTRLFADHEFPVTWSLGIIAGILFTAILASLLFPPKTTAETGAL